MRSFTFERASQAADAVRLGATPGAKFLGGGTNLVDLMRESLEQPQVLIDVSGLSRTIEDTADGGLLIGAGVRNTALIEHHGVRVRYPVLARALLAGASPQIRNMATVGGNLLQRTRCAYFYDSDGARCNKRSPGQGCDARDGFNRHHAILGASPACVATHPSDMCVALSILDATVHVRSAAAERTLAFEDFHRLPGERADRDTELLAGELITSVQLPPASASLRSTYRKVRDRSSYAFALVSVAAAIDVEEGVIKDIRIGLGGVAHKPWRARMAESMLRGARATEAVFDEALRAELTQAQPLSGNGFKIELARRTTLAVLGTLAGTAR